MDVVQVNQFEQRKKDHIRLSLDPAHQSESSTGLERVQLIHEAFPELDFDDIQIAQKTLNLEMATPFLVSSMTAGHEKAPELNRLMARKCEEHGWLMGVGSQRRELSDEEARREWSAVRKEAPGVKLLGNIGLAELISAGPEMIVDLALGMQAVAMIVHTNPLQECIQPEGGPKFKGGLEAVRTLTEKLPIPVVVKETGCGMSAKSLLKLNETGVAAVDVSGKGGTHWGRIEGSRCEEGSIKQEISKTFANWGITTVASLVAGVEIKPKYELWGSGGVRTGLDAAKLLAMGATVVGMAQPILEAAVLGEEALEKKMSQFELELKTSLFCTGSQNIIQLQENKKWQMIAST